MNWIVIADSIGKIYRTGETKPEIIVVGTGFYGAMDVPSNIMEALRNQHIELIARKTSEAAKLYNELSSRVRRVAAALHLTC